MAQQIEIDKLAELARSIKQPEPGTPEFRERQRRFCEKLLALQGKLHLDIDLDALRGRNRR